MTYSSVSYFTCDKCKLLLDSKTHLDELTRWIQIQVRLTTGSSQWNNYHLCPNCARLTLPWIVGSIDNV